MSLFNELKRRNVFRVAIAYLIAAWLLIQLTDILVPLLTLPEWVGRLVFLILLVLFVSVLIAAWALELTPDGIKLEKQVDRSSSITPTTGKKLNALARAPDLLVASRTSTFAYKDSDKDLRDIAIELGVAHILADRLAATEGQPSNINWLLYLLLDDKAAAENELRYFEENADLWVLASRLTYHRFDPSPFPELMAMLARVGVQRPPPAEMPYTCPVE